MQIAKIDVFQVDLPYAHGTYHLSGGRTFSSFDATIVRLTTACAIEGWGESTPFGANYIAAHAKGVRAGIDEIAPHLLGQDPRALERINTLMDNTLVGHAHAKTPLDVACWDIFGKAVDLPVYTLLGGSSECRMPTISSIPSDNPEAMRQRVADYRQAGYLGHSIKIGASEPQGQTLSPNLDAERIKAALADAKSGEFFIVDANGGMSCEYAQRVLALLPNELDFVLEAPCATWREHKALRQRTNVPIFIDELADSNASLMHIISENLADGIGLKISKSGGLSNARKQRDICQAAGLVTSVQDTVGSAIAFAAIVHLAQTIPAQWLRCVLDTRDMVTLTTATFNCKNERGGVIAPNVAGLGVNPDLAVLGEPVATYS